MNEITEDVGRCTVTGEVVNLEMKDTKNGQSKIVTFSMTDYLGSVNCKLFLGGRRSADEGAKAFGSLKRSPAGLKNGNWVKAGGNYRYDDFKREMVLMVLSSCLATKPTRRTLLRKNVWNCTYIPLTAPWTPALPPLI